MKWFDRSEKERNAIVEKIAKAYENEDFDRYENLLERYSSNCREYNLIEDTVIEYCMYGSHEIS